MDARTTLQKKLDELVGPPLYYCDSCKLAVHVKMRGEGLEPVITRPCGNACGHQVIAPRKAIAAGVGGLNFKDKVTVSWWQFAARLTGRCV